MLLIHPTLLAAIAFLLLSFLFEEEEDAGERHPSFEPINLFRLRFALCEARNPLLARALVRSFGRSFLIRFLNFLPPLPNEARRSRRRRLSQYACITACQAAMPACRRLRARLPMHTTCHSSSSLHHPHIILGCLSLRIGRQVAADAPLLFPQPSLPNCPWDPVEQKQ